MYNWRTFSHVFLEPQKISNYGAISKVWLSRWHPTRKTKKATPVSQIVWWQPLTSLMTAHSDLFGCSGCGILFPEFTTWTAELTSHLLRRERKELVLRRVAKFWAVILLEKTLRFFKLNSNFWCDIQLFREWFSHWKASKRTWQYRKAWWAVVVHCCIVKFTSFQRDGRRCYEYLFACVKRNKMDSELLTCLLKIIEYFPDYLLDNLCRNSCIWCIRTNIDRIKPLRGSD